MYNEKLFNVAGVLQEEIMESYMLMENEKEEKAVTHTSSCATFLTILCC